MPLADGINEWKVILTCNQDAEGHLRPFRAPPIRDFSGPCIHLESKHGWKLRQPIFATQSEKFRPGPYRIVFWKKPHQLRKFNHCDKYIYILGAGKKMSWRIPIEGSLSIHTCGAPSMSSNSQKRRGYVNQALKGRLKLSFSAVSTFAPFSDLNEHCIYFTNAYFVDHRSHVFRFAETLSVVSRSRLEILDADVFIYRNELQKIYPIEEQEGYTVSQTDEMINHQLPMTWSTKWVICWVSAINSVALPA